MAFTSDLRTIPEAHAWLKRQGATRLVADSRSVKPGDAFIAWPGYANDGRQFVAAALRQGAVASLVDLDGASEVAGLDLDDPRVASMKGLKANTGHLAHAFYGAPSETLDVLAVTGTNGKTSTAWWLAQAFTALGRGAGVMGTLGVGVPPDLVSTGLTTPDPVTLHAGFKKFVDQGLKVAAIEASSIGLLEDRLNGARLAVALFTNFTQDHLDFHGSMEAYWLAKRRLFDWPGLQAAVVNLDDARGVELAAGGLRGVKLITYTSSPSSDAKASLRATDIEHHHDGLSFTVSEGAEQVKVQTRIVGDFNVHNLLAVLGGLRALNIPLNEAVVGLASLSAVPGRMQQIPAVDGKPVVVVDYAHTPDALAKVLSALRPLASARGGRLWCVFGCGGDRDPGKRPLMGAVAARTADVAIVTSDNPRHESPDAIAQAVLAGMPEGARLVLDRRDAIHATLNWAGERDVVLIAGKGHEDYQDVRGIKHPFSDVSVASAALMSTETQP